MQVGGWYNGQQWDGTKLSAPGTLSNGTKVSNEVISQTNPANVAFVQQQQLQAGQIAAPVDLGLPSGSAVAAQTGGLQADVDRLRNTLNTTLTDQKAATDQKLADLRAKEQGTLEQINTLSTPFRADMETAQRESLHVNANFEANQALVDELDSLLTQGNDLIRQQSSITGLSAVRNPRIQQTMNDVAARAGVIQAVISARNGQIAQAENMIDRSIGAIQADRQDQLAYYNTVLSLDRQDIVTLDAESKKIADQQVALLKDQMDNAQASVDYVKKLLIDPATAQLMGQAGVRTTDSIQTINGKLTQAQYANEVSDMANKIMLAGGRPIFDPSSVPAGQLITVTDSRGVAHYYQAQPGAFGTPSAKSGGGGGGGSLTSQKSVAQAVGDYTWQKDSQGNAISPFMQLVADYANAMSLDQIYKYYLQSPQGQKFGAPKENRAQIQAIYDAARGA
jgi:ElaB/YqjD/DUF883 family membrane-anchored ribosome-binding protein